MSRRVGPLLRRILVSMILTEGLIQKARVVGVGWFVFLLQRAFSDVGCWRNWE